jgi:hypothetical protein
VESDGLVRSLRDCVDVDAISDDSLSAKNALWISLSADDGESGERHYERRKRGRGIEV